MPASVQQLCEQRGLSVAELSDRSGLEEDRTLAIVQGRWTPSPRERERIAAALGTTIEAIAWGHATPIQHLWGN